MDQVTGTDSVCVSHGSPSGREKRRHISLTVVFCRSVFDMWV